MSNTNKYDGDSSERPGQRDTEKVWAELEPEGIENDVSDLMPTGAEKELLLVTMDFETAKKTIKNLESQVSSLDADNLQLSAGNEGMYNIARELCGQMTSIYDRLRVAGVSHGALELLNVESTRVYALLDKIFKNSNGNDWRERRDDLVKVAEQAREKVEEYKKQIAVLNEEVETAQKRAEAVNIIAGDRDRLQARINELEAAAKVPAGINADEYDRISADRAILQLQVSELEQNLALKSDIFNKNAKSMTTKYTESLADNAGLREANEQLAKENSHVEHDNLALHEVLSDESKKLYVARRSAQNARKLSLGGWTSAVAATLVAGFVYFNGLDAVANEEPKPKVEYSEPAKVVPTPIFKYVNNKFVAEFGDEKYSMSLKKADEIMSEMEKSNKELSPAEMKKYFSERASKEIRIND
jgi:hypothetical protein